MNFDMSDPLTFATYQQWFRDYDAARGLDADRPLESLTHLSEEIGEIARHLLRLEGVKSMKDDPRDAEIAALALELSDAFVFLTKLANHYGIEWDATIKAGMEKAEARWDVTAGQDEAHRRATRRNS
jgi:NTP pyrophosphatase (non-canonical NTP hydrolase)